MRYWGLGLQHMNFGGDTTPSITAYVERQAQENEVTHPRWLAIELGPGWVSQLPVWFFFPLLFVALLRGTKIAR